MATPIYFYKTKSLNNLKPSSLVAVKQDGETTFSLYVTDKTGIPYPIKDNEGGGGGGILSITNTDNNLEITGINNKIINISPSLLSLINSALQSGDNISELVNDAGYITINSLPTKTSDVTNNGSDGTSTYVEADELGAVATSNDYNDLDNLPTIPTVITNHSGLTLDDGTNPHNTTKSDVGLGNVDNTSDLNKPISTATQTALNLKLDKVSTVTTERQFYVKNSDGTQAMANESDIVSVNNDIYYRKIQWWATGGNTATSLEQQGAFVNYPLQYLGTKQNPATVVYGSNRLTSTPRLVYRSDATAGARAGMFTGRSSVYPFGFIYPFTIVMRFDTSNLASASKSVMSAGLYSSSGGVGAVNPSTLINCILLANDETDTNLHIIHNDNTGTATKIDLGSDFLVNQSNQYYELILDYDGTSVTYKVSRWDNLNMTNTPTAEASGVISTDLPTAQAIKWIVECTNYDVAEAVEIAVSNVELYLRY